MAKPQVPALTRDQLQEQVRLGREAAKAAHEALALAIRELKNVLESDNPADIRRGLLKQAKAAVRTSESAALTAQLHHSLLLQAQRALANLDDARGTRDEKDQVLRQIAQLQAGMPSGVLARWRARRAASGALSTARKDLKTQKRILYSSKIIADLTAERRDLMEDQVLIDRAIAVMGVPAADPASARSSLRRVRGLLTRARQAYRAERRLATTLGDHEKVQTARGRVLELADAAARAVNAVNLPVPDLAELKRKLIIVKKMASLTRKALRKEKKLAGRQVKIRNRVDKIVEEQLKRRTALDETDTLEAERIKLAEELSLRAPAVPVAPVRQKSRPLLRLGEALTRTPRNKWLREAGLHNVSLRDLTTGLTPVQKATNKYANVDERLRRLLSHRGVQSYLHEIANSHLQSVHNISTVNMPEMQQISLFLTRRQGRGFDTRAEILRRWKGSLAATMSQPDMIRFISDQMRPRLDKIAKSMSGERRSMRQRRR